MATSLNYLVVLREYTFGENKLGRQRWVCIDGLFFRITFFDFLRRPLQTSWGKDAPSIFFGECARNENRGEKTGWGHIFYVPTYFIVPYHDEINKTKLLFLKIAHLYYILRFTPNAF